MYPAHPDTARTVPCLSLLADESAVVAHLDARGSMCIIPATMCPVILTTHGNRLPVAAETAPELAAFLETSGRPASFPFVPPLMASLTLGSGNALTWTTYGHAPYQLPPMTSDGLHALALALKAVRFVQDDLRDPASDVDTLLMLLMLAGNVAQIGRVRADIPNARRDDPSVVFDYDLLPTHEPIRASP